MGRNPSHFTGDDKRPVECVSWDDVQEFIRKLNAEDPGKGYRLPTEAEWEYACRAGTTGERYGELDEIAWYDSNASGSPQPAGRKGPNAWGLFDMLGNVWEWCADRDGDYQTGMVTDPTGPASGSHRVLRGGSWVNRASACRSANRIWFTPNFSRRDLGFRLARSFP